MNPNRAALISEKSLQEAIIEYAEMQGWRVYHTYDSRRCTPGFPDLVMVRGGHPARLIFAELKKEGGRVSAVQRTWLNALEDAATGGAGFKATEDCRMNFEVYVWRPKDWMDGTVEEVLG